MKLEEFWIEKAKELGKTIVLPEAYFSQRILEAGLKCVEEKIAKIIFLTDDDNAFDKYNVVESEYLKIINIKTHEVRDLLISTLYEKRKEKGVTLDDAKKLIDDPVYFATMLVELSLADGMVAGAEISTLETFKPGFQIIRSRDKDTKVSSFFIMVKDNGEKEDVYLLSDCGVNINPTAEEIVGIAKLSSESARLLCKIDNPKVALLSYSTMGSAEGDDAIKMRTAKSLLDREKVDFIYDGEMQLDCAIVKDVAMRKAPNSKIQGDANIFVFPNLSAGNIAYKMMQRFGGYRAYGPIAQGMKKPINDVSRGATVYDIIQAIAITVLQN